MAEQIRAEIARDGAISFARFMDLALYCPHCGYYERKEDTSDSARLQRGTPGKRGDFYTSVSVGPLFGELLAFQFEEWLKALVIGDCALVIAEAGAHDGRLANDILTWLRSRRAELFERIEYRIIEPSARRQQWQKESLKEFAPRVQWHASLITPPPLARSSVTSHASRVTGIIFSNELLDSFPLHRFGWDAKRREWFEWGVAQERNQFVWTRIPNVSAICNLQSAIGDLPRELLAALPDGFTTEICPAAENWWREAAGALKHCRLLTLDYGLNAEEVFAPHRANGTLRAYHRHCLSGDVLANPGEQDLTAHVNFTALQRAGEAAGLETESLLTQSQFLTRIAQGRWKAEADLGIWTGDRTRQFQTLTHPQHLGRAFRVLIQSRGA